MTPPPAGTSLPHGAAVGVVCAHPDDETFGLGAIITAMVATGSHVALLSLTRGEDSTLGAGADLATRRVDELHAAAEALGIGRVVVGEHPDGALTQVPHDRLVDEVCTTLGDVEALLTFDHGGITGHPDHQRATDVSIAAGRQLGIPVLGWALPEPVAARLHEEFGGRFVGRSSTQLDHRIEVDRSRQHRAIGCHASQDNPVPRRRIELQGPDEYLRDLHLPDWHLPD